MPISNIVRLQTKMLRLQTKKHTARVPVGFTSSFYRFQISALRDTVVERTVCPADDICNAGSIEEKLRPRTKSSKEENRKSSPAAQRGRKSNSIRPL